MVACFDVWLHHTRNIVCSSSNYSSLGSSTEEEALLEEEESSGDSDVALGPQSTTGRHQHFISTESILFLKEKEEEYIVIQSCLQVV